MDALCDDELLAVRLWLDARALEATERVCRRWRRLALSPTVCHAHRPGARVWERLADRAAVVAERTAERNWLAGRYRRNTLPWPHEWGETETQLDGPRLAVFHEGTAALFDARTLAPTWRVQLPGQYCTAALENARLAVFVVIDPYGNANLVMHVGAEGTVHATQVRLDHPPSFMMWRDQHVAYGVYDEDDTSVVMRMDAASGQVTRSLSLGSGATRRHARDCTVALADDIGIGVVTDTGLLLDDGRSAAPALFPMEAFDGHVHRARAHPDGRTVATVSYNDRLRVVRLWDMRALGRPRAAIPLDPATICDWSRLSFGRGVLRISTALDVLQLDLSTGERLGVRWGFDARAFRDLQSTNEAFATIVHPADRLSAKLDRSSTEITVCSFDTAQ